MLKFLSPPVTIIVYAHEEYVDPLHDETVSLKLMMSCRYFGPLPFMFFQVSSHLYCQCAEYAECFPRKQVQNYWCKVFIMA